MKRCLQLVALIIAALLAVPPALAHELCLAALSQGRPADHACCLDAKAGANPELAQPGTACGSGCCTVSAPNGPTQSGPAKAQSSAAQSPSAASHPAAKSLSPAAQLLDGHARAGSAPARYLLLRVFRI